MRLLTHNLLACHAKTCGASSNNFPLKLQNVHLDLVEADWNESFLRGFLPKLDYAALVATAHDLNDMSLPAQPPDVPSEEFLRALHHTLLEVHVADGEMVCQNCGHVYRIRNGIPNMVRSVVAPPYTELLAEHEIPK
ncbi:hypothetical protein MSPP1_003174 [Malassezia sp. CBS 17886]|nr:hypothetical protein MSPP1_003174 [Malassezia sp. CBS 17886]